MKKILIYIDNFLNRKTMYQLVFQGLIIIALVSIVYGFLGIISYSGVSLIGSVLTLSFACYISNIICAKIVGASPNFESSFITALILFFIIAPAEDMTSYGVLALVACIAMASKYILALRMRHIFNPAGTALLVMTLTGIGSALWWVATAPLLPFVLILGLLILRKLRIFKLFFLFLVTSALSASLFTWSSGFNLLSIFPGFFISWPVLFFGMIMLTEPRSTPPTQKQQMLYALITGFLFGAEFHIGPLYSTPQLALIVGNIYTFIVSPKYFAKLVFREKKEIASGTYEFSFTSPKKISQIPGQYIEWTLPHEHMDSRGIRRYFTIASSPTEEDVKIGVRIAGDKGSSFKKHLMNLQTGDIIVASGLTGEFVLPKNPEQKLVFIAGGIGVTPFRSIIKYLIDTKQKRDIVLIYSNKFIPDIAYKEIFDQAEKELGIKTLYVVNDPAADTSSMPGVLRLVDGEMISTYIPDYKNRLFYISGPLGMINAFEQLLVAMNVPASHIKTDFFSGY